MVVLFVDVLPLHHSRTEAEIRHVEPYMSSPLECLFAMCIPGPGRKGNVVACIDHDTSTATYSLARSRFCQLLKALLNRRCLFPIAFQRNSEPKGLNSES